MSVTDRSRRRVEAAMADLEARFGEYETVERAWEVGPAGYESVGERFEAGTVGGAMVWVRNDDGEVLLVRHGDGDGWAGPGGKHEPGETLVETARREVREETGVDCSLTDVLLGQVIEMVDETHPDRPAVVRFIPVFAAEYEGGELERRAGEIAEAGWFDHHPDSVQFEDVRRFPIPAAE